MANTDIRQFGTAAKRGEDRGEEDEPIVVGLAGREVTLHSPGSGQLSYLAATLYSYEGTLEQLGGLINFIANLLEEEDARWFKKALLDNDIDFDGEDVLDLCYYIIEEWSQDRPTKPSSGSASPRRRTGASSTADTPSPPQARRRSTSPSRAS